ncbi:MAG: hypothetical protein KatS3mg085_394 [Candidatus Dojkabacteria bacterium]|nr:MAG: hypothetical protein KatS3mg085_394 [Candidatus Dojkabacteria bacterium]
MVYIKKAFSLLEIIVVLGITAAVMSGGVLALIRFQDSAEFNRYFSDTVSLIKTTQNRSYNGVLSQTKSLALGGNALESVPEYYAIIIDENDDSIGLYYCDETLTGILSCFREQEILVIDFPSDIQVSSTGCSGVGFKTLNPDIILINSNGTFTTNGVCEITLTHTNLNRNNTLEFNADNNVFELN